MSWYKLAILTDEVSQELEKVISFASEFRLDGIELRSLWGKAFRDLSPAQIREVRTRCDDAGLLISACASPVFKCDLGDAAATAEHIELFRRSVDAAHVLGCEVVRVFSFHRPAYAVTSEELQRASTHFLPLLEIAERESITIGLENEASCLVGTGHEMHELLRHLPASPRLGVVWDPCNVLWLPGTNAPFPDEYEVIADRVCHVHVKDARRTGSAPADECVELGTGAVNFPGQFAALRARGYRGWFTLETHWRPVRLSAEAHHLPAGYAFSAGAEPASRVCMAHLQRMLGT